MADWRLATARPPLEDGNQILPWIPPVRKDLSVAEMALVAAVAALFVVGAMIASDARRAGALWRWCLTRHLFFRAPFYRFIGMGWLGLFGSTGG